VTIVEYSDFDCPFCSRFHDSMNEIVANNPDVAWVYRHFPLEQLHPEAEGVAMAAECVGELAGSDAFWSFTDEYFAVRGAGDSTAHDVLVPQLAADAGVSSAAFTECMDSGRTQSLVQEDVDNAVATGGRGTPWSILIGPTGETYPINGALPTASIEQLIQVALEEA
jgi:protein-disulfide isomerase